MRERLTLERCKKLFEVERMTKTRVLCAKSDLNAVTNALYDFGAIHVTRAKSFATGTPLAQLERISPLLIKLRGVEDSLTKLGKTQLGKAKLGKAQHAGKAKPKKSESNAEAVFAGFAGAPLARLEKEFSVLRLEDFDALVKQKQSTEAEFAAARARARELEAFKEIRLNTSELEAASPGRVVAVAVFEAAGDAKRVLARICERGEARVFHSADGGSGSGKTIVLAAVPKNEIEVLRSELGRDAREVTPPQIATHSTFCSEYAAARERLESAWKKLACADENLAVFAEERGEAVTALRKAFETEFRKANAGALFGQSELAAAVEGWIPVRGLEKLRGAIEKEFNGRVLLEEVGWDGEAPPSKLHNPRLAKSFETLTEFFSLPRYNEIDPTLLTALTYPLFFGMILGDVGYGAILVALGFAIWFKAKGFFKRLGGIMAVSGFSTAVFGFVFGECFGAEEFLGIPLHPFISRIEEEGIALLIALAVLVGFLHLSLGLLLGALEAFKAKNFKHALAKISWVLILVGFSAFITNAMPDLAFVEMLTFLHVLIPPLDLIVLIAGIAGLVYFEGPIQVFEIPGLMANLLSYLRIMALGLSGVAIAGMVAKIPVDLNALATLQPVAVVTTLAMIALVVLGHALAIALGIMEAGIQSLRLHYVEFYSKFYKGGGVAFKPFKEESL